MAIQAISSIDGSLKKIRILQLLLPLQLLILVYAGEILRPSTTKDVSKIGFFLILVAILNTWSVLSTRRRVRQRCEIVRAHPDDTDAIKMWTAWYIAGLLGCLAVALYGWLLRVMGGTFLQAAPFYGCALLLLLLFASRQLRPHPCTH